MLPPTMRALVLLLLLAPALAFAEEPSLPPASPPAPSPSPPAPPAIAPRPIDLGVVSWRWQIMQDSDGRLYRVRKVHTPKLSMWAPGLAVFVGSYVAGGLLGLAGDRDLSDTAWIPFVGPIVQCGRAFVDGNYAAGVLWPLATGAEMAGLVIFVEGLQAGPDKLQRHPIVAGPVAFVGGGAGAALSGRF